MKPHIVSPFRFLRTRRGIGVIAAVVVLLFLFRPGVYKLRNRIATSIGSALGRRVALDNVRLRLLPRPGFDLEGLVIYDDPTFGEEPMIRAQEVSAAIRFRSLLRGRLEIATLSATEPSINLVRNVEGQWNLASLLERNRQIPAAPTGKPPSERRPAFPYLEASNARINFKLGEIKKSYALVNADVALWQDSENSWGARMKAAPVRTDFNLTDTGVLQINATWQRASSLKTTPMQIVAQWRNGQLGQITKLLSGKDRGWRGGIDLTANISGTPESLKIVSASTIDGFHRYDIVGSENVRLATTCSGQYEAAAHLFSAVLCESPVSDGMLRLRGNVSPFSPQVPHDLTLEVEKVPLASVIRILRQAKKQLPDDLTATGRLNAQFHGKVSATSAVANEQHGLLHYLVQGWSGTGAVTNARFLSTSGSEEIHLGTVPLALTADTAVPLVVSSSAENFRDQPRTLKQRMVHEAPETRLRIGPASLAMNDATPMEAGGWISATGYRFDLRGDADLKELFRFEDVLGLPVAHPAAEGAAKLDMSLFGQWQGFAPATAAGSAQLRNVHAEMHGLNTPIEMLSATMTLTPDTVTMDKIVAHTGATRWTGKVTALRHCAPPSAATGTASVAAPTCMFQFDLAADQLSSGDLGDWFTRHPAKRPWYRILNYSADSGSNSKDALVPTPLLYLQAKGTLRVGRFVWKKLTATQLATQVAVERGKITLTGLRAQLLQGTQHGDWTIDVSNRAVTGGPLRYHGSGSLQDISLAQLSNLMDDDWINGTVEGKFELDGAGDNFREVLAHSEGKLQFVMRNGSLPHVEIPGSLGPLPVHRFSGELRLKKNSWELIAGKLESHDGIYEVSGTESPLSGCDFVLTRGDDQSWTLTGSLTRPQIISRSESQRTEADINPIKP